MTPAIALLNDLAADGPYFPAPLVAFGFFALPIGFLLFLIQVLVVGYEIIARRALGNILLFLGAIAGLAVGSIWYFVLTSSLADFWMLLAVSGSGVFQGLLVFGCHWIAYKLKGCGR